MNLLKTDLLTDPYRTKCGVRGKSLRLEGLHLNNQPSQTGSKLLEDIFAAFAAQYKRTKFTDHEQTDKREEIRNR